VQQRLAIVACTRHLQDAMMTVTRIESPAALTGTRANKQIDDGCTFEFDEVSVGIPVAEAVTDMSKRPSLVGRMARRALAFGSVAKTPPGNPDGPKARRTSTSIFTRKSNESSEAKDVATAVPSIGSTPVVSGTRIAAQASQDAKPPRRLLLSLAKKGSRTNADAALAELNLEQASQKDPQSWTDAAKQAAYDAWWARRDRELRATPGVC